MVKKKKNKIVCFAKIWKPLRQHFGFFEDWQNFGSPQKFGKV